MKVFINPGHDTYKDSGAVNSLHNLTEASVARDISERVETYLKEAGLSTKLMQNDYLTGVCYEANKWQANIFVSIHCNAFNGIAQGTETLVYCSNSEASRLANCIQDQLVRSLDTIDRGVKERKDLGVLRLTNMPAVLIEVAFIDNEHDVQILIHKKDEIAKAIARGITDFFSK